MEIGVVWGCVEKNLMRSLVTKTRRRKNIDEDRGDRVGFDPVYRRMISLKEERVNHFCYCADHALGMTILLRSIWTRIMQDNAGTGEKSGETMIAKFAPIVALNRFDGRVELILHKRARERE